MCSTYDCCHAVHYFQRLAESAVSSLCDLMLLRVEKLSIIVAIRNVSSSFRFTTDFDNESDLFRIEGDLVPHDSYLQSR